MRCGMRYWGKIAVAAFSDDLADPCAFIWNGPG